MPSTRTHDLPLAVDTGFSSMPSRASVAAVIGATVIKAAVIAVLKLALKFVLKLILIVGCQTRSCRCRGC